MRLKKVIWASKSLWKSWKAFWKLHEVRKHIERLRVDRNQHSNRFFLLLRAHETVNWPGPCATESAFSSSPAAFSFRRTVATCFSAPEISQIMGKNGIKGWKWHLAVNQSIGSFFRIMNSRVKWWLDRKRHWISDERKREGWRRKPNSKGQSLEMNSGGKGGVSEIKKRVELAIQTGLVTSWRECKVSHEGIEKL